MFADLFEMASERITKNNENELNVVETACKEVKIPVVENADMEERAVVNNCDTALTDYLFPLPAVEEGAAILVTTKTSASFSSGMRGDTFAEISQCMILDQENKRYAN